MSIGIWQIVIVAVIVILLFGRGKISELMGDVAKGIRSFREGLAEGQDGDKAEAPKQVSSHEAPKSGDQASAKKDEAASS